MAAINLRDRDGLHSRVEDVVCPVLWLHVSFECGVSPWDGLADCECLIRGQMTLCTVLRMRRRKSSYLRVRRT
jgi:hypothetical protein